MSSIQLKVLFLSAANNIHTIRWVNALAMKGVSVVLVSLPNHSVESHVELNSNVIVRYLPFSNKKGYYLNAPFFQKMIYELAPDVLNVHYAAGYGTLARIVNFPNTLLNLWGSDVYEFPRGSIIKRKVLEKNLKKIRFLASTSHVMAEEVRKYTNKKVTITPFGVDTTLFCPNVKQKSDIFRIGIVKTLERTYGIDILLEAFKIALEKNSSGKVFQLDIYGKGALEEELINQAIQLGIRDCVNFCGAIEHDLVPAALRTFDLFCCPSREESFGVAVVEAMACELPVVVSDAPGLKEVVDDGVTGWIVPREDSKALAEKIIDVSNNPNASKAVGKNGRRRVLSLYDWVKNVDELVEVYKAINSTSKGC